jgi:regulator of protease activity HflC (stomatin/prohibitin superfamily)
MTDQSALAVILGTALITLVAALAGEQLLLGLCRILGVYAVVEERTARVYMLFGKVVGILNEPGLYFLPSRLGPSAFVINLLGNCYVLDLRLDQEYLRSQPVNSEEGAPMGIGIWYEMQIGDPVSYLFKNTDPRGSLRANVSNATVRCLSNMKLAEMLETRHQMSQSVRAEVTGKSQAWGYQLGSVYIRKVHFRDAGMIRQIEEKVVNRLRQVTSAIKQAGANQVSVITSSAEREAAIEFAKAAAIRPATLGQALQQIAREPAVSQALFDVLETQRILAGSARLTLLPPGPHSRIFANLLAAESAPKPPG